MLPAHHRIFTKILICTVLLPFLFSAQVSAHIEKGAMPDSVAEMEYRILLEFEPENLEVRNQLGMVLYRRGKLDAAAEEFNFVLAKAPDNFDATDALGLINMQRGNYQLAIILFKKAIAINPDDMLVYYHLGQALELQGDIAAAAAAYREGLTRDPAGPDRQKKSEQREVLLEALKNIQEKAVTAEEQNL